MTGKVSNVIKRPTSRTSVMGNASMSGRGHGRIGSKQLTNLESLPPESLNRSERRAMAANLRRK